MALISSREYFLERAALDKGNTPFHARRDPASTLTAGSESMGGWGQPFPGDELECFVLARG